MSASDLPDPAAAKLLLTHGVAIEPGRDRVRYIVPPEDDRRGRALLQLTLGLIATVAIIIAIYLMYSGDGDRFLPLQSLLSPYLEMSVFFALAVVADAGRRLLAAERVIDVSPETLSVQMRVPLLSLRFTRRADRLEALVVTDPPSRPHFLGGAERVPSMLRLRASPVRGRSLTLATADRAIALALAEDLSQQLAAFGYDVPVERLDAIAKLEQETQEAAAEPPRENAEVTRTDDRLEIVVGRTSFLRRFSAYGGHAVLAVVLLITAAWLLVLAMFFLQNIRGFLTLVAVILLGLAAWAAAAGYRRFGRQEDVIIVEPDAVHIVSTLGEKVDTHVFPRADLRTVMADSHQLLFIDEEGEGTSVSLLRHEEFVGWLAATLRRECGLLGSRAAEAGDAEAAGSYASSSASASSASSSSSRSTTPNR